MAKRKNVKYRTRTITKRVRARAKKKNTFEKLAMKVFTAGVYGAVRPVLAEKLSPISSKIPAGEYADEVGMLILTGLGVKYSKGILKDVSNAGFLIEGAFLGQQLGSKFLNANTSSVNNGVKLI